MDNGKHKLYFSTDINMCGKDVLKIYRSRFQVEFVFRDDKQRTSLCHCQARKEEKKNGLCFQCLNDFCQCSQADDEGDRDVLFNGQLKSLMFNPYLINRFIVLSGYRPNKTLIAKTFKDLIGSRSKELSPYAYLTNYCI